MATDVDPLESWKEIAAYLKRDVTTVQRWEKREGLPIHRHLHDKSGSVFALKHELDRWRRARTRTPEVAGDLPIGSDSEAEAGAASRDGVAPPPLVTGPSLASTARKAALFVVGLGALIMTVGGLRSGTTPELPPPVAFTVAPEAGTALMPNEAPIISPTAGRWSLWASAPTASRGSSRVRLATSRCMRPR
jgi:hypothetical protein